MPRLSKLNLWFKHFTDEGNPDTFMNRTGSAKAAGYKAKTEESFRSIGYENFTKLDSKIGTWMDEVGMSDAAMDKKHMELGKAKETKIFKVKGYVDSKDLPPGVIKIATSGLVTQDEEGENQKFSAGETVLMIRPEALTIQRQILESDHLAMFQA